jgi:hypothetical protein
MLISSGCTSSKAIIGGDREVICVEGETKDTTCPDGITTYLIETCVNGKWSPLTYIQSL